MGWKQCHARYFRGKTSDKIFQYRNRVHVCLFSQNETARFNSHAKYTFPVSIWFALFAIICYYLRYLPLVAMVTSTHNFPSFTIYCILGEKFFIISCLVRINKLDHDFYISIFFLLVCPPGKSTPLHKNNLDYNTWQMPYVEIRHTNGCWLSLSIRRFWGKRGRWKRKRERAEGKNDWHRCFYWSLPPLHSVIRCHPIKVTSGHWVVSFTCQKARLK